MLRSWIRKRLSMQPTRCKSRRNHRHRRLCVESLSPRLVMTGEGQTYAMDYWLDASELMGDVTGAIQWGDGTSSPATIASKPAAGPLRVRIDYSLDSNNFFQANERRVLLQTVLDSIASRFSDSLSAIQPVGSEYWEARFKNPSNGADVSRRNLAVGANELVVFVGARALSVGEGGLGNRGGTFVSSTRQQFVDTVRARGQTGALANPATDVGPWGGAITFDTTKNWYFGSDLNGIGPTQLDFVTVAAHEFLHVLGFGTTDSFNNKLINSKFTGTAAGQEYGAQVPMADADHFANNLNYRGRRPIMVPSLANAERLLPSRLDLAAMHDIGWRLITPSVRVTGSKVFGDNATFAANITLQGARIGSKSFPLSIPITNVAPTFDARGNATAIAGFPLTLNRIGQFSDPGFGTPLTSPPKAETFTYRIQWGDNTSDTGNATVESVGNATTKTRGYFNGTHTYANPGVYTVTLTVTDDDGGSSQQQFQITVAEQPKLTLSINKNTFSESAGSGVALLTISRPSSFSSAALVVQLRSSDTSEATLPATATIPAGLTSITVGVNAVDDALFDGPQAVELSASATSLQSSALDVTVTDHQPISMVAARADLHEDIPEQRSTRVTIGIRSPAPVGGARVTLAANQPGILQFPTSVTVPAGSTQVDVTVSAVDDLRPQRLRNVVLTASGNNLVASSLNLSVNDSDPYRWTNPNIQMDVDANGSVDPLDVLRVINEINRRRARQK
jgi:PKD repeat protein